MKKLFLISAILLFGVEHLAAITLQDLAGRWQVYSEKKKRSDYLVLTSCGTVNIIYSNGSMDGNFSIKDNTITFSELAFFGSTSFKIIRYDKSFNQLTLENTEAGALQLRRFWGVNDESLFYGTWKAQGNKKGEALSCIFSKDGTVRQKLDMLERKGTYRVHCENLKIKWNGSGKEESYTIYQFKSNDYVNILGDPFVPEKNTGGMRLIPMTVLKKQHDDRLHKAIGRQDDAAAAGLINSGIDITETDADGATPLHWAARKDNIKIALMLLEKGASRSSRDDSGYAPLHWAALYGKPAMVRFLVEKGTDINIRDRYGCTPLHAAASWGYLEMARYLIEKGAFVDVKDNAGYTQLHVAAKAGMLDIVKLLVGKGAAVNTRDQFGYTPLHWAAGGGLLPIARYLIDKGATVNAKDSQKRTPLHWAAEKGHVEMARLLLRHGARQDLQDHNGKTCLDLAKKENREAMVELLSEDEE